MTAQEQLQALERELMRLFPKDSPGARALSQPIAALRPLLAAGSDAAGVRRLLDDIEDILESCCAALAWRGAVEGR